MNEIDFQELFKLYHASKVGSKERKKALEILHCFVYEYPHRRFRSGREAASEFYMEVFERIETWFHDYDPNYNVSFIIYLNIKLRGTFFNFIQKKRDARLALNSNDFHEINPDQNYTSLFGTESAGLNESDEKNRYLIQYALNQLSMDEQIAVRLHYGFPLKLSHFRALQKKHTTFSSVEAYRKYLHLLAGHFDKESAEKENTFMQLVKFEVRKRQKRQDNKTDDTLRQNRRKTRLIVRFNRVGKGLKLKVIAEVMNENVTYVHRRLKSGKILLTTLFEQETRFDWVDSDDNIKRAG